MCCFVDAAEQSVVDYRPNLGISSGFLESVQAKASRVLYQRFKVG
jgi:hypothetical protein